MYYIILSHSHECSHHHLPVVGQHSLSHFQLRSSKAHGVPCYDSGLTAEEHPTNTTVYAWGISTMNSIDRENAPLVQ